MGTISYRSPVNSWSIDSADPEPRSKPIDVLEGTDVFGVDRVTPWSDPKPRGWSQLPYDGSALTKGRLLTSVAISRHPSSIAIRGELGRLAVTERVGFQGTPVW